VVEHLPRHPKVNLRSPTNGARKLSIMTFSIIINKNCDT
jgi:hypothetical protein